MNAKTPLARLSTVKRAVNLPQQPPLWRKSIVNSPWCNLSNRAKRHKLPLMKSHKFPDAMTVLQRIFPRFSPHQSGLCRRSVSLLVLLGLGAAAAPALRAQTPLQINMGGNYTQTADASATLGYFQLTAGVDLTTLGTADSIVLTGGAAPLSLFGTNPWFGTGPVEA